MGNFKIIFPCQITTEQIGLSFEFLLGRIILHLEQRFKILEKNPKKSASQAHPMTSCGS